MRGGAWFGGVREERGGLDDGSVSCLVGAVWMALDYPLFKHTRQIHPMNGSEKETRRQGSGGGGAGGGGVRETADTVQASIVTRQVLGIPPVRGALHH